MPTQWRTRDRMTDTVGHRDTVRDTERQRRLLFRFSDVMRRENPADAAAAAAADDTNLPDDVMA